MNKNLPIIKCGIGTYIGTGNNIVIIGIKL